MARRVSCTFFVVVLLVLCCFRSRMPLYVVACVRVASFAPWTSSSLGMSRFRGSGCCLFAPCFTSASLPSFPSFLSWPFTHCIIVLADLCLIRWATFLKNLAFLMSIQPSFSQDSRWVVRPSSTYFESVSILTGWYGGMISSAAMTAMISPIWLDWVSPGTHSARFRGSFCANQTPLLQHAFCFPLSMQAPLVYTVISLHHGVGPWCLYLCAM